MVAMAGDRHHAEDCRPPSVRFPRGVPITDAELQIIQFFLTSNATRPADLSDWFLGPIEGDHPEDLSNELITAASLLYLRRRHPGISFDSARALITQYADDPRAQ
jgi:hypothetical protein